MTNPITRFLAKVQKGPNGCWLWLASKQRLGYGMFQMNGKWMLAHRAAYELLRGAIPSDMDLHHVCEQRACVNPYHLTPVTTRDHLVKHTPKHQLHVTAARRSCKAGHAYTPENTRLIVRRGGIERVCRQCAREASNRCSKKRGALSAST